MILYYFLTISSHGKFTLKIPDLSNINISNTISGLKGTKDQLLKLLGNSDDTSSQSTKENTSSQSTKENGNSQSIKEIQKNIEALLQNKEK